jgi:WD40 repeat protein
LFIEGTMKLSCTFFLLLVLFGTQDTPQRIGVEAGAVLEGHKEAVLSVAFSRDGKRVATGGADKHARVWEVGSGDEAQDVYVMWAVTGIAISEDGKQLVTGSWGGQIWEIASGNQAVHLESHTGFVTCAALSPNGKLLATGGLDATVKLWNPTTWQEVKSLNHGEQLNCLAFSHDGKLLASGGDSMLKLWEIGTGKELKNAKSGQVSSVCFDPNGKWIATASSDKTVRIRGADDLAPVRTLALDDRVLALAVTDDGKNLGTAGADKTARIWNTASWKEEAVVKGHEGTVTCLAFSHDGKLLLTGSEDKTARIWKLSAKP